MGRVLGIDFGTRRVGVAISDQLRIAAHGYETISWNGEDISFVLSRIACIISEKDVDAIVIGKPQRTDGSESESQRKAVAFGDRLAVLTGLKPAYRDERFTTVMASRFLSESGVNGRNKRKIVDQVAAEIILTEYLESLRMKT